MSVAVGGVFYIGYDYSTCHPMRKLDYDMKGALIRLNNIVRNVFPARTFDLQELSQYDGSSGKTYFSAEGLVYDVSESEMFRDSYALWAGKDATISLAKMSLAPEDANRLDLDVLNDDDYKTLRSWSHYFGEKYYIVGQLKEFKDR